MMIGKRIDNTHVGERVGSKVGTVSQERFQPMMSPTRDFILEMILRQPYIEMLSSPQNIFVPLFEILTTLLGEIY